MIQSIYRPKYIALDTSHIIQWIRDHTSNRPDQRQAANNFSTWLKESGHVPLFTLHHIEELCNHNDINLVRSRLRFLASLQFITWIGDEIPNSGPGLITDILRAEVIAAYRNPQADIIEIRQIAFQYLLKSGSGEDMLGTDVLPWLALKPYFMERAEKARALAALIRTGAIDDDHTPIGQFLGGKLRDEADRREQLISIRRNIIDNIERYGDRRINNPAHIADKFINQIKEESPTSSANATTFIQNLLIKCGIDIDCIKPESKLSDLLESSVFIKRLELINKYLKIPWADLKQYARIDRIPSQIIYQILLRHAEKFTEHKGSEINDIHLACLAAYADVTLVDKRIFEIFRRSRTKEPLLDAVCNRVEKASSYRNIPDILKDT